MVLTFDIELSICIKSVDLNVGISTSLWDLNFDCGISTSIVGSQLQLGIWTSIRDLELNLDNELSIWQSYWKWFWCMEITFGSQLGFGISTCTLHLNFVLLIRIPPHNNDACMHVDSVCTVDFLTHQYLLYYFINKSIS